MAYIPKRVLLGQFPASGLFGVQAAEVLDLAIDGDLPAYYQIPMPFHLHGDHELGAQYMGIDYGDFHGPLAQLTPGILIQLQAHGTRKFDKTQGIQVLGFQSADFGPPPEPVNVREAFEKERCFWLILKDAGELELDISRVIILRNDIEYIASRLSPSELSISDELERERIARMLADDQVLSLTDDLLKERLSRESAERYANRLMEDLNSRSAQPVHDLQEKPLHPSERKSASQIIAALASMASLDLSAPYAADETLRKSAAIDGLELPGSPETVVKFLKAAATKNAKN